MKHTLILFALISGAMFLQFCSASRAAGASGKDKSMVVSYEHDVAPIMVQRCTPCHFPDGGKKKFLDTYAAVRSNVEDIIDRIQMPADAEGFMPFKSKKEPLSDSLILVFKTWQKTGMAK